MARRKNTQKPQKNRQRGRRKAVLPAVLLAFLIFGGIFGWMGANAHITRLKYAQVYLEDLPAAFEGTKVLYISDINIRNDLDSAASIRLMKKLGDLQPDMLLLGGDYTANTLLEVLNGAEAAESSRAGAFIESLASFFAPMGKFAVPGDMDNAETLAPMFAQSGVQLLQDGCAAVERGGEKLVIAGLNDAGAKTTPYEQIGGYFNGEECVIALAHNPSAYVGIRVAEARGGGAWADMVLSGHTLGGQIQIAGRTLRTYSEEEARCIGGWYYTDDLPMLVSGGLGCQGAKLRMGSESEVWMLTLHRPRQKTLPKLGE